MKYDERAGHAEQSSSHAQSEEGVQAHFYQFEAKRSRSVAHTDLFHLPVALVY